MHPVDAALFVKALGGFFAIMNPFIALPMFLALTSGDDPARQRRIGVQVVLYSLAMCIVIMASGAAILDFFGISVSHFRVAGGIVLMTIGLGMLNGGSSAHEGTAQERAQMRSALREASAPPAAPEAGGHVAFYPLTFPMILGPGTIASIIVFTGQAGGAPGLFAVVLALAAVLAVLFVVLWFAPAIGKRMSETLRIIMTRLMGMIVAAIAVAMATAGLQELIPILR